MALTLPRWIIAAAVGCFAVWFVLVHTERAPPADTRFVPPPPSAVTVAENALSLAADRLRLLRIRDSVIREAGTSHTGLSLLISSSYGSAIGTQIDSLIRARWREAGAPAGAPVVIAAVLDSSTVVDGAPRLRQRWTPSITTFLPDTNRGAPCISILRVVAPPNRDSPRGFRLNLLAPQTIAGVVGPCLYYASFGRPGARIAGWLNRGNWRMAQVTDWRSLPPPPSAMPLIEAARLRPNERTAYDARYRTSTTGLACLAGEAGRCAQAVLPPSRTTNDSAWAQRVVSTTGANDAAFGRPPGRNTIGPADGWLLSEMVRTLGKERFLAFWRSEDPIPDAFRAAAGETLDTWVHDWAVRIYGPLPTGPGLGPWDAVYGALLVLAGVVAASRVARTRRVS